MSCSKAQVPANAIMENMILYTVSAGVILTAGTMFVMWLGEKITDKGIGNGISLIIMIGIIAWLPQALIQEGAAKLGSGSAGGAIAMIVEMVTLAVVVMFTLLLLQGVRNIPVQYEKSIVGNKKYSEIKQ